jgi:hypothetical protein
MFKQLKVGWGFWEGNKGYKKDEIK